MKKTITITILLCIALASFAQNAKKTMDKAVASFKKASVTATYIAKGQMSDAGTIQIKGNKFCARGKQSVVWYDGKTQWTYMKSTEEVNVVTPNKKKVSVLNPYEVLNLYKNGYTLSEKKTDAGTVIHMTATGNQAFKEIYLTLDAKLQPVKLNFKNSKGWTYVTITNYIAAKLPDSTFKFSSKEFPNAEINDLR
ncbi:MAG: cell envelope biogenesis protein LolA [Bacteroidaceae bacterium]|nr:cell envelope biogenesis protein LolA [Bacteroidaceae bacterium]